MSTGRRQSGRNQNESADTFATLPGQWPYENSRFQRCTTPTETLKTYRQLSWLADNRLHFKEIDGKGLGVVAKEGCEGIVGILMGEPCRKAQRVEAGTYSFDIGDNITIERCLRSTRVAYDGMLFNHACTNPTVIPKRTTLDGVPVVIFKTINALQAGQELTFDYNAGLTKGGYVLSAEEFQEQLAAGRRVRACCCAGDQPCPKGRGFWL
jgi:hypothetical protein